MMQRTMLSAKAKVEVGRENVAKKKKLGEASGEPFVNTDWQHPQSKKNIIICVYTLLDPRSSR